MAGREARPIQISHLDALVSNSVAPILIEPAIGWMIDKVVLVKAHSEHGAYRYE